MRTGSDSRSVRFILASCITIGMACACSADTLTLSAALAGALANSSVLAALDDAQKAAEARTREARGAYLPTAAFAGGYSYIGPVPEMSMTLAPGHSLDFKFYPANNYDVHLGLDAVVLDFGRRGQAVALGRLGEQGVNTRAATTRSSLAYQTAVLFGTVLMSEKSVQMKTEDVAILTQHLQNVQGKLVTGTTTEFEVLRTQVQLTNTQTDLNNLANDCAKRSIEMCEVIGMPPADSLRLRADVDTIDIANANADSMVAEALKNRNEITLAGIALRSLAARRRLSVLERAPIVAAHASLGVKDGYIVDVKGAALAAGSDPLNDPTLNWVVGGQIEVPILDQGKARLHVVEADAQLDSARQILKDTQLHIRIEVLKAVEDLKSARENLRSSVANVQLASEAFRIARLQYGSGVITNLDLLDAEEKFAQARLADIYSDLRYTLTRYALQQAIGFDFSTLASAAAKAPTR